MTLSTIDKEHLNKLLASNQDMSNYLNVVKHDHVNYSIFKRIVKQMNDLKLEAIELLNDSLNQKELHSLNTPFKLVCGQTYYLYNKENTQYFSLIGPTEWNNPDMFVGEYLYDYDHKFIFLK